MVALRALLVGRGKLATRRLGQCKSNIISRSSHEGVETKMEVRQNEQPVVEAMGHLTVGENYTVRKTISESDVYL